MEVQSGNLVSPWKFLRDPQGNIEHRPYVTTSGIAIDSDGNFPILYRSEKVRSAKCCWSLPSGLHEIGTTLQDQFAVELKEELSLDVDSSATAEIAAVYENLAPHDGYHWVIALMIARVKTLETLVNREPDKHSEIRIVNIYSILNESFLGLPWAPGLGEALRANRHLISTKAMRLICSTKLNPSGV